MKDKFAFATQHEVHLKNIRKWIMNSEATKHTTSYGVAFDTYEVFFFT